MKIKECTVEMIKDLAYISKKTFSETFAGENSKEDMEKYLEENYSQDKLTEEILDKDSITYLAYEDSVVIGYIKLNQGMAQTESHFEDSLEIQRIYVTKEAKGMGVGSRFIELAEKQADKWNLKYIWLGVWEHNYSALRFYEAKGFKVFSKHIFVLGNDEQTDLLMKKELNI